MPTPEPKETTKINRAGLERACKEFTARIGSLGFQRTKKMFWTRRQPITVEFIHFHVHGSTYGAPLNFSVSLRVHFGIRVLNDAFPVPALNGPESDAERFTGTGRYHLRFNAKTGDTYERCLDDLVRFVVDKGEPWFQRFRSPDELLEAPDSPLRPNDKQYLADALAGHPTPDLEANSLKMLGIKRP